MNEHFENLKKEKNNPKIYFKICPYIQKMKLNLIETFKMSIYSPKHTKNTKIHVNFSRFSKFQKSIFSKSSSSNKSAFCVFFVMALLIFYVEGHTA